MKKLCITLLTAMVPFVFMGGSVRSLSMDDGGMEKIRLAPGKSTVLRFIERPEKIILGNQNHYKAEFIGNDVAIRPQGHYSTNLFVYTTGGGIFGFLLSTHDGDDYDDLVKIRRKRGKNRFVLGGSGKKKNGLLATKQLTLRVKKVEEVGEGVVAVLLSVTNNTERAIDASKAGVFVTKDGKRAFQKIYLKKHVLEGKETTEAKVVFIVGDSSGVAILNFEGQSLTLMVEEAK